MFTAGWSLGERIDQHAHDKTGLHNGQDPNLLQIQNIKKITFNEKGDLLMIDTEKQLKRLA